MRTLKILLFLGVGYGLYELFKRFSSADEVLRAVGATAGGRKHSPTHHTRADAVPFGKPGLPMTGGGSGTAAVTEDFDGGHITERVGRGVVRRGR